jgi:hypothetical protein
MGDLVVKVIFYAMVIMIIAALATEWRSTKA